MNYTTPFPFWSSPSTYQPQFCPLKITAAGTITAIVANTASLMADSKTSGSCSYSTSGSPIASVAQDHLLSILLFLPIDSILSFSMTCKRFKLLASSDTLWEFICKREWGPTSVEALKSSFSNHHQLPWMRIYQQVSQLDSVICHRLSDQDSKLEFPNPRASHSFNFVSDCLVLYGGGCDGGRHLDDTWVAYVGNDFRRILKWEKANSGIPSGRFGHTCVVISEFLVLFGGINDQGIRQNDTWVGQVTWNETLDIRFSWKLIEVGPIAPPPRGAHAACCINNNKMVIHGGIGLLGVRLDDTWVLKLSENLQFGTWHEIVTNPSPPPRSGHSLTCIGDTQTVLFGGRGLGYEVLNDIWFLDIYEDRLRWVQLLYEPQNIPQGNSLPRVGHSANLILGGRLLIYGGEDSYRHRKNDFWILDISSAIRTIRNQSCTLNSKGSLLGKMWKRLEANGYKPDSRSFHRACVDHSGRYLYMFGGMVDGIVQPAEASGLRFDGELFLVELTLSVVKN